MDTWQFLEEWDISVQDDPYGNELAFEVTIHNDETGRRMMGAVWAESEAYLRADLVSIMKDEEAIEALDPIYNPYTY